MTKVRLRGARVGGDRSSRRRARLLRGAATALMLLVATRAHPLGLQRVGEIVPMGGETGALAPTGLWYDDLRDLLVIACPSAQRVLLVDRQGMVQKEIGKGGEIPFPGAVTATRQGTLYVASPESESIAVFERYASASSTERRSISLSSHRRAASVRPSSVFAGEDGRLYVADRANRQVLVLDADGKVEKTLGKLGEPTDVWADRAGNVYVAEPGFGGVRVYDGRGRLMRTLGTSASQFPEPVRPRAIAVDRSGRVWILEEGNRGIRALDASGNLLLSVKGDALFAPVDLALDGRGNLFVLEEGGNRIAVFRISGT